MKKYDATEQAYKNGYEAGKRDASKHGRWLEGNKFQPCSLCHYRGKKSWNYCPNCGAIMDLVEEPERESDEK